MKRLLMAIALVSLEAGAESEIVDGVTWYYETFSGESDTCARIVAGNERYAGDLTIPPSLGGCPVTSVGSTSFYGRKDLTSVTIPEGVTDIGDYAFCGCRRLRSVTIPSTVTSIGRSAFSGCGELASVTVPAGVTSIADGAFSGCGGLTSFSVAADNPKYASVSGLLCSKDGKRLVAGVNGAVAVPQDVTSIGDSAFKGCSSLTSIQIPVGVLQIGADAFAGCGMLTSVTIPACVAKLSQTFPSAYRVIREVVVDEGVTSIGSEAFADCRSLESVVIPSTAASIGASAFKDCDRLTSLAIPAIMTSVAADAFCGCGGLMSFSVAPGNPSYKAIDGLLCSHDGTTLVAGVNGDVVVPPKATRIGDYAFAGRDALTSIAIPATVTSVGKDAFRDCHGLISAVIPPCVVRMSDTFPDAYRTIREVAFSGEVTEIAESAFRDCNGLELVTIPASVTSIGGGAFENCYSLPEMTIPEGVAYVGERAFLGCAKLAAIVVADGNPTYSSWDGILYDKRKTELIQCPAGKPGRALLPSSVGSIGHEAFYNCSVLEGVALPANVTNIGNFAFYACSGLPAITIPKKVSSIGERAFLLCSGMTAIDVAAGNEVYCSQSGILYDKAKTELIQCPAGKAGYVSVPLSVKTIGSFAFFGCRRLTSAAIPKNVTKIGPSAYSDCTGLTAMTVPDGVAVIEGSVFSGCSGLGFLRLPPKLTGIGSYAFSGCSGLSSVTIPTGVTSIGEHAFSDCSRLTSAALPAKVTTLAGHVFAGCSGLRSVRMSADVTSIGEHALAGCSGLTMVTIPGRVKSIGDYAFSGCTGLPSVTIPTKVERIGDYAFSGCTGLVSALIPYKVEYIGGHAFSNCAGLKLLTLSPSLRSIGDSAFSGCVALPSVQIPNGVESIGKSAFSGCRKLTAITLPTNLRSIGDSLFRGCVGLTSFTLPPRVTSIGDSAFHGCTGLTSAVIPQGVESVGGSAFYGCGGLRSVVFPASARNVGRDAFSLCDLLRMVFVAKGDRDRVCRLLGESGFDVDVLSFEEIVLKLTAKPNKTAYGTVTGGGTYGKGQPVQLKATAKSGYVFAGWYVDKDCTKKLNPEGHDNRERAIEYAMPGEKTAVYAKFVSKSYDKKKLKFSSSTAKLAKSAQSCVAGGTMSLALGFTARSLPTVTAKSLPKGMSIDPLTGLISGKPSKPGKYTAKVTVKTAAGNKISQNVKIYVKVPSGHYGTFHGYALVGKTPAYATFTSDGYGKVSGKVTYKGKRYGFTASYSSSSSAKSSFTPSIKIGKTSYKPKIAITRVTDGGVTLSEAHGEVEGKFRIGAQKKLGYIRAGKALAELVGKSVTIRNGTHVDAKLPKSSDYLKLKFGETDKVTVSGKLKGGSISFSTAALIRSKAESDEGTVYSVEVALIEPKTKYYRLVTFAVVVGADGEVSCEPLFGNIS